MSLFDTAQDILAIIDSGNYMDALIGLRMLYRRVVPSAFFSPPNPELEAARGYILQVIRDPGMCDTKRKAKLDYARASIRLFQGSCHMFVDDLEPK